MTGEITFVPEAGFKGNPTPVDYQVAAFSGALVNSSVTVTYVEPAVTRPAPPRSAPVLGGATPAVTLPVEPEIPAVVAATQPLALTGSEARKPLLAGLTSMVVGFAALGLGRRRRLQIERGEQ